MNWKSVKESLPEHKGRYLVARRIHGHAKHPVTIRQFHKNLLTGKMQFWSNGREDKDVTHWAKLLEYPDNDKDCVMDIEK